MPTILGSEKVCSREKVLDVILDEKPADLVIKGGKLVNVNTGEIYRADVAIKGGRFVSIGDSERITGKNTKIIDARGKYLTPGLVDGHLHFYHAYTTITEFSKLILTHGTTTTVDGFYGPGIVGGMEAIKFLVEEAKKTWLKIIFLAPALAYSQNRELGIAPTPTGLSGDELLEILKWPECFGLEEPQPSIVLAREKVHMDAYRLAHELGKIINGHLATSNEKEIQAYAAMGSLTDHETVETAEGVAKARSGILVMGRQGTGWALDIPAVVKGVTEHRLESRYYALCTDALPPGGFDVGGLNLAIRNAVCCGIDPVTAVYWASLRIAEIFRVNHEVGSITPGRIADVLLVDDLQKFKISTVVASGEVVAKDYKFLMDMEKPKYPEWMYKTVRLMKPVSQQDFEVPAPKGAEEVTVRTIFAPVGSIITPEKMNRLKVKNGHVQPDVERDIIKISMVDRFQKRGGIGDGFIENLGLSQGAIGMTVNAVCENLLIAGTNSKDMAKVAGRLAEIGGGMLLMVNGEEKALVELALLGLLSDEPAESYLNKYYQLNDELKKLGWKHGSICALEFMGAPGAIGHLKITDEGLLDVDKRRIVPVVVE